MANEGLKIKQPGLGGAEIDLNGTQWGMEQLDLGIGAERDEMIAGSDSDGARPARVAKRDNREVTCRIRLQNAAGIDDALSKIGAIEQAMTKARQVAASGPVDPIDTVRLVYSPAGSTKTFFLPIYAAEISGIPKVISGDDAGWFINFPVLTMRIVCDPYGYGALTTYLSSVNTPGGEVLNAQTINGGAGDVPPWLRLKIKDLAAKPRGLVRLGVKRGTTMTPGVIAATWTYTGLSGMLYAGSWMTCTSIGWTTAAQIPQQTKTGQFKLILTDCYTASEGKVRVTWAEAGGGKRQTLSADIPQGGVTDLVLGDINPRGNWDAWVEVKGDARVYSLQMIPTDSYVEVKSIAGVNLTGPLKVQETFNYTDADLNGNTVSTGAGAWATSATFTVEAAYGAKRTAVSMASPVQAVAGSTSLTDCRVGGALYISICSAISRAGPAAGFIARYVSSSAYVVVGITNPTGGSAAVIPGVWVWNGVAWSTLWSGVSFTPTSYLILADLQINSNGQWFANVAGQSAAGFNGLFASGEALASGKVGLHDQYTQTSAWTRYWQSIYAYNLAGNVPVPIPSAKTLILAGPTMTAEDGAQVAYTGASGLEIEPGANNTLAVIAHRSAGTSVDFAKNLTDALNLQADGYPRYISLPR